MPGDERRPALQAQDMAQPLDVVGQSVEPELRA
jgi:hypothetical protein